MPISANDIRVPTDRIRMARNRHVARLARVPETEIHEDYRPTGIAPRIGHVLGKLAAGDHPETNHTQRGLAETILRTGDHSMLPILADALDDESHPASKDFDWRHAPRGIEIDKALGKLVASKRVRYPLDWNRWGIAKMTPNRLVDDWSGVGPNRRPVISKSQALATARVAVGDATNDDILQSASRLHVHHLGQGDLDTYGRSEADHSQARANMKRMGKRLSDENISPLSYPETRQRSKLARFFRAVKYAAGDSSNKLSFDFSELSPTDQATAHKLLNDALRGRQEAYGELRSLLKNHHNAKKAGGNQMAKPPSATPESPALTAPQRIPSALSSAGLGGSDSETGEFKEETDPDDPESVVNETLPAGFRKAPTPKYTYKPGKHPHPDVGLFGKLADAIKGTAVTAAERLQDPAKPFPKRKDVLAALGEITGRTAAKAKAATIAGVNNVASTLGGGVAQVGRDVADVFGPPAARVASGLKDLAGFDKPPSLAPAERNAGFGVPSESKSVNPIEHFHATYVDPQTGRSTQRIIMTTKGQDHVRKWLASQKITPKTLRPAEPHELTIGMGKGTRKEKFRRLMRVLKYALRAGETDEQGDKHEPEEEPDYNEFIANQFKDDYGPTKFGITPEVGYLLPNGHGVVMGQGGTRGEDHRAALPSVKAMTRWGWPKHVIERVNDGMRGDGLNELLRRSGAMRVHSSGFGEYSLIHFAGTPTDEQRRAISQHILRDKPDHVTIEHVDTGLSKEIASPRAHQVLKAIDDVASAKHGERFGTHPEKYTAYRAPAGGMIVRGQFFKGGSLVPDLEAFAPPSTKAPRRLDRLRAAWKKCKPEAKMECGQPYRMPRDGEPHDETYSHAENVIRS